jgi:hypothetical protein
MNDTDWGAFVENAQNIHSQIEKEKLAEQEMQKIVSERKQICFDLGISVRENLLSIPSLRTGQKIDIANDFQCTETFENAISTLKNTIFDNAEYRYELEVARQLEAEKKVKEIEQAKIEKEKLNLLNAKTIEIYSKGLKDAGFEYKFAPTLEDGEFNFKNSCGHVNTTCEEIIRDAETVCNNAIKLANAFSAEADAKNLELQKEKENKAKQEAKDLAEATALALENEAKRKKTAQPTLKKLDDARSQVIKILSDISPDEITRPYYNNLLKSITDAWDYYEANIKHLK